MLQSKAMSIGIIDYEVGNLTSVLHAFQVLGVDPVVSSDVQILSQCRTLVLPGQGAIKEAMIALKNTGCDQLIKEHIGLKKPFLGICLGLQLLFDWSEEDGGHAGLGLFKGQVKHFEDTEVKVPHMGWNTLNIVNDKYQLFEGINPPYYAYFAHSYYLQCEDSSLVCTTTNHPQSFVSSIQSESLLAIQFHPEKSSELGLGLLKNFLTKLAH